MWVSYKAPKHQRTRFSKVSGLVPADFAAEVLGLGVHLAPPPPLSALTIQGPLSTKDSPIPKPLNVLPAEQPNPEALTPDARRPGPRTLILSAESTRGFRSGGSWPWRTTLYPPSGQAEAVRGGTNGSNAKLMAPTCVESSEWSWYPRISRRRFLALAYISFRRTSPSSKCSRFACVPRRGSVG